MSSYLDFGSTKKFRDSLISRTLNVPNGPQTFTESDYQIKSFDIKNNIDQKDVDYNRENDLNVLNKYNTYKPEEFYVIEELNTLPQVKNLRLYPYFNTTKYTLFGMNNIQDYEKESELLKFASQHIKNDRQGPLFSRIEQNHLLFNNGSTNFKITPFADNKEKNFLDIVEGKTLPWDTIEGDYLTNPLKPIINRPTKTTELGKIVQDVTGKIGEMFGIKRRENRNPSDLFIENMGEGQKQLLFFNISFSKYGPNYTNTARTKNSSSLFGFIDDVLDGKMGDDAPYNYSYIGDDRNNNVKNVLTDGVGNHVRSSYYLSMLFDPDQTNLFNRTEAIINGGSIGGPLTWISNNSKNKLGLHNNAWSSQSSQFNQELSTEYSFREGSIMGLTQDLLNTLPNDGLASRSHVANVIDQTSRMFKDGNKIMSRGSAVKYVNKEGEDVGAEYCRVWTKDRPYFTYGDTMKRQGNIRNYDGSVMGGGSRPWNLNVAPMSDGNKSFNNSTNIREISKDSFIAQKYMLSIENLAWKTSNIPGFTFNDLPFSERGPNGGRVMWFPPYDIKITESNSASWDPNNFLGRPEPIYTYKGTERTGTLSFKIIVDHPSVLNLLVREHFKNMSDREADDYIDAFFSGCEELDFYDLIRRYSTLDSNDIDLITQYLNNKNDTEVIKKYKLGTIPPNPPEAVVVPEPIDNIKTFNDSQLLFPNDYPVGTGVSTDADYDNIYSISLGNNNYKDNTKNNLVSAMETVLNVNTTKNIQDRVELFGKTTLSTDEFLTQKGIKLKELDKFIDGGVSSYAELETNLETIKKDITDNAVQEITIIIESGCSAVADIAYNYKLSLRRTHSIIKKIFKNLSIRNGTNDKWTNIPTASPNSYAEVRREYSFKDLGFEDREGKINLISRSAGEKVILNDNYDCGRANFHNVELKKHAPIAFGCRQSTVKISYDKATQPQIPQEPKLTDAETPRTMLLPDGEVTIEKKSKKPNIDVMKRIIMKTLSEGFYFKKLEETDPHIYSSLREKLKYFHPAFHSMTPEGLNSRLTFLNQCLRPGDTIPIKGQSDVNDLMARNTTFGPPPVSILRIGDFYHSKVIFDNLQINFEESTWDLNPEGIGIQPMLASVTLQIKFLGGHGLEKPVERLQNALSSNFYANTEMYDERSQGTNTSIGGKQTEEFTKQFLEDLYNNYTPVADSKMMNNESSQLIRGQHIGEGTDNISYNKLIKEFDDSIINYFKEFEKIYNETYKKYGKSIAGYLLTNTYRNINSFNFNGVNVNLLGVSVNETTYYNRLERFKNVLIETVMGTPPSEFIKYGSSLNRIKKELIDESLNKQIIKVLEDKFTNIKTDTNLLNFEKNRDNIIRIMDKINFLLTKGYDCVIDGEQYKKTNLEEFSVGDFNNVIEPTIKMITKNNKKTNKISDNTIDFNNINIDNDSLIENLSLLLNEEDLVFNDNSFTQTEIDVVNKAIKKFIVKKKEQNFNFDLKPNSTKKDLSFKVLNEEELTDEGIKKEIFIIFKEKMNNKTDKLNYYRKNV